MNFLQHFVRISRAAYFAAFFIGGMQRLASVTEKIVPVMAGLLLFGL